MSLNDEISSPTGIAKQLTSPNNFFKRILTKNIPISMCKRGHFFTKMANFMCKRGHFFTKMANFMCRRGHFLNKMPSPALCKNRYL